MKHSFFDKVILVTLPLSVLIFLLDLFAPSGVGEWMLYFLPLLFTSRSSRPFYPVFYALFCTALISIALFVTPISSPQEWQLAMARRLAGVFLLWATTLLLVQRKRAESAQRESEERFASFMNNSTALAWMKDANFNYVYINQPHERFFKTTLAQIKGKNDFEIWPESVARELRANDVEVLNSEKKSRNLRNSPRSG